MPRLWSDEKWKLQGKKCKYKYIIIQLFWWKSVDTCLMNVPVLDIDTVDGCIRCCWNISVVSLNWRQP